MFSSCLENIEPEGIENLRGAKAELLRAQTALQAAQAAKVEAEAALVLAQAKVQEAIAKQEEAKVKYEEALALKAQYEAEYANIQNEAERARLEKLIADNEAAIEQAKLDAELYALQLQEDLLVAEEAALRAQQKVEQALRDIAVAKATLTDAEASAINTLETAVKTARDAVESKTEDLHDAAIALARAVAEIDGSGHSTAVAALEQTVLLEQAKVEAAKEAEAEAKALLEADKTLVDWDVKRKEIADRIDSLNRAVIIAQEKVAATIIDAGKAIADIEEDIEMYEETTGYELDFDYTADNPAEMGTGLFGKIPGTPVAEIEVPDVQILNDVLGDFELIGESYVYGKEDEFIADNFDDEIRGWNYELNYFQHYDKYWLEDNAKYVAEYEKDPEHLAAMERHADAAATVKSGKYLDYFAKYVYTEEEGFDPDFNIEDEIKAYNDALAAFKKGIADYEAEEVRLTVDQIKKEEIESAEQAEIDAAEAVRVKGYQEAESKYRAAKSKYEKAQSANAAAVLKRDRAIEIVIKVAEADEATMVAFEAAYVEAAATDEDKAKHLVYEQALKDIKAARDAYEDPDPEVKTDPESIWAAASDQWTKDQADYAPGTGKVYADIDAAYTDKMEDINVKYAAIWADFNAKYPNFDQDYRNYWVAILEDLKNELRDAAWNIEGFVEDILFEYNPSDETYEYSVNLYDYDGTPDGELNLDITSVARYLTDGKELVEISFDGLLDKDYFVENEVIEAANDLWYEVKVTVSYKDGSNNVDYTLYADENSKYPYEHLTYEEFVKFFESIFGSLDTIENVEITSVNPGSLIELYVEKLWQDVHVSTNKEYYDAIPDYIKAIEAAKAEFVAYVAEKEAELAAVKAEIEAVTTAFIETVTPIYEEFMVAEAKGEILGATLMALDYVIADYMATYDFTVTDPETALKDFEASLVKAYNDAVDARIDAEKALVEAEWAVEEAKAGNLNAIELAQLKYDRAAEELAEAIAALEKASADLEAMLAVIYGAAE